MSSTEAVFLHDNAQRFCLNIIKYQDFEDENICIIIFFFAYLTLQQLYHNKYLLGISWTEPYNPCPPQNLINGLIPTATYMIWRGLN